jgi:hypothetical protein
MHFAAPFLGPILVFAFAQDLKSPPAPQTKTAAVDSKQLVEDLRILRKALEEGHSGIYRYTPKAELDGLFDETEKALNRPMTSIELYRVLAPVVAAVKCGHTWVVLPDDLATGPKSPRPILPLQVRVLGGKVWVFRDFSNEQGKLAGKEIRSINGAPAAGIVETMVKATPGDGDVQTSRLHRIRDWRFCVNLVDLLGQSAPYALTSWDPVEKRESSQRVDGVEMAKLLAASRDRFPQDQRPETAASFRFLDGDRIAVMKINGFGGFADKEHKKNLKVFFKESFAAIEAHGTKALVIDLRDNGGGADELGKLLLSYLVDKPFKYYDDLVINSREFSFRKYARAPHLPASSLERKPDGKYQYVKHPNWGIQQPSTPTFQGKVFILINGGSFSTTSEFLSHVHYRKRATFIGEESAGGYYGNTSGPSAVVTLPNTKLKLLLPLMTYYMSVSGNPAASHGVVPDYPVTYSIQELLEGKDKDLALAIELAAMN